LREVSSVQGKLDYFCIRDDSAYRGSRGLQLGRSRRDYLHGFHDFSDLQADVQAYGLVHLHHDSALDGPLKAGDLHRHVVAARRKSQKPVVTALVRLRAVDNVRGRVRGGHGGAGNDGARFIADHPDDASISILRSSRRRQR